MLCALSLPASSAATMGEMSLLLFKGSPFSGRISTPFPVWALVPSVFPDPLFSVCSSVFASALHHAQVLALGWGSLPFIRLPLVVSLSGFPFTARLLLW